MRGASCRGRRPATCRCMIYSNRHAPIASTSPSTRWKNWPKDKRFVGDQGILRRHPPLDRDYPTASATATTSSPASTTLALRGAVGRRHRLGSRPGHRLPRARRSRIYQLMKQGRREEALKIYRWVPPLLDLDVSTYLVQNIKLAEGVRWPIEHQRPRARTARQPLSRRAPQGGREDRQGCAWPCGRHCRNSKALFSPSTGRDGGSQMRSAPTCQEVPSRRNGAPPLIRCADAISCTLGDGEDIAIIGRAASSGSALPPIWPKQGCSVAIFDRTGVCEETSPGNAAALRLLRCRRSARTRA